MDAIYHPTAKANLPACLPACLHNLAFALNPRLPSYPSTSYPHPCLPAQ